MLLFFCSEWPPAGRISCKKAGRRGEETALNQKNHAANIDYSKHQLARIITVYQIVSADYVEGRLTNDFHTHTDAWELVYCKYGRSVVTKETTAVEISAGQIATTGSSTHKSDDV